MKAMDRIVSLDEEDMTVDVESGVMGDRLEAFLNERGYTLGHSPQSLQLSTVGGWISTKATGQFSSRYGGIEDILCTLEAVLPTGGVVSWPRVPRSATGPRLMDIFIGGEGCFGVITRAVLKVMPLPDVRLFRAVAFPSVEEGFAAIREMFRAHIAPPILRLHDEDESREQYRQAGLPAAGPFLILAVEGTKETSPCELSAVLRRCGAHGGRDLGPALAEAWFARRYDAEWLDRGNEADGHMADSMDVAASWRNLPVLYRSVRTVIAPLANSVWAHFSHFYPDGGSIYFIFFLHDHDNGAVLRRYDAIWTAAMQATLQAGGTITHHHGVGLLRGSLVRQELGTAAALLRTIKQAVDPQDLLNPGKLGIPTARWEHEARSVDDEHA